VKFLAVKDFALFQHYRDRNPPWIKLYGTLLSDAAFLQMPEAAQAQLVKLWILASQLGHPLPNNPKLLAGRIGSTGRFYLQTLIDAGFIIPREESASPVLAKCEQEASPSVRVRGREESGELEIEKALSVTPAVAEDEAGLAVMLATDADRIALTAMVTRVRSRAACIAALRSMLMGQDPACRDGTPEQFGQALRDYTANGAEWNASHFRGYLKRASAPPRPEELLRPPRRGGVAQRTWDNGVAALKDL
jgi:hypothetical protein